MLGNKAYVGYEGTEYAVDSTTFGFAKSLLEQQGGGQGQSSEIAACRDAAGDLNLADFVDGLKDEGSAEVGGTSTTKVSGNLDVERDRRGQQAGRRPRLQRTAESGRPDSLGGGTRQTARAPCGTRSSQRTPISTSATITSCARSRPR